MQKYNFFCNPTKKVIHRPQNAPPPPPNNPFSGSRAETFYLT